LGWEGRGRGKTGLGMVVEDEWVYELKRDWKGKTDM
jgi:hypothetical protein